MDHHLSSSPRTLSSWWKSFKQRDEVEKSRQDFPDASKSHLGRPSLPHMSHSSSAVPKRKTSDPLIVINEGKPVTIPRNYADSPIFGTPLEVSIKYASVKISLTDRSGNNFVYGRVPVVVAKCSVYLKQEARDVAGIFRISGSVRRIRLLQDSFNTTPRFGKDTEWEGFSVHDAANVFRRYLNYLPEPIVPLANYEKFRSALRAVPEVTDYMEAQAATLSPGGQGHSLATSALLSPESETGPGSPASAEHVKASPAVAQPATPSVPPPSKDKVSELLSTYEELIFRLPPVNLHLIVYLLDLLSVFSAHSQENLMPAFNLAAVFQPSILSHPQHDQDPKEYQLSRLVVEFLITHANDLLRRVEKLAIDEHERISAAGGGATPDTKPSAVSSETSLASTLVPPMPEKAPENLHAIAIPRQRGAAVPSLVVTNDTREDLHSSSDGHRRLHSKSLSSAQPPKLISSPDARSPTGGMFSALRRQVSTSRRRVPPDALAIHGNDSSTSVGGVSFTSGDEELRATSPVRSEHDSIKSRFRRSLLIFRHGNEDDDDRHHSASPHN